MMTTVKVVVAVIMIAARIYQVVAFTGFHAINHPVRLTRTYLSNAYIYTQLDEETTSPPTKRNLQRVLRTIEYAAYKAGEITLATSGKISIQNTKANVRDLVTESDIQCQSLIKEIITKEFPNDLFLGEEDVCPGDVASSEALRDALSGNGASVDEDCLLFVVDPIDGTTNFQAGLPLYAISIGVVSLKGDQPEVVVGSIYNPTLKEMTSGVKGRGCYLNNQRIQPNIDEQPTPRKSVLNQSLVNVGFPIAKESTLQASSRAVSALATKVRGLRMIASASQTMAWVAQSKLNAYFSWDLNAWDIAAGVVIVEESGGMVSNFDGSKADISSRDMIITSCPNLGEKGLLRDELIGILKENDCINY